MPSIRLGKDRSLGGERREVRVCAFEDLEGFLAWGWAGDGRLGLSLCGDRLDGFCKGDSRSPTARQVCVCAHFGEAQPQ